jgi:hypothetical protein
MSETKLNITDEKSAETILKFTFIFVVVAIFLIWYFNGVSQKENLPALRVSTDEASDVTSPVPPSQTESDKEVDESSDDEVRYPISLDLYGSGGIVPPGLRRGINYYAGDTVVSAPAIQLINTQSVMNTPKPTPTSNTTSLDDSTPIF